MYLMSEIEDLLQRYQNFIWSRENKKLDAHDQCDRGELTQFQLNKILEESEREINFATKKMQELRQQSGSSQESSKSPVKLLDSPVITDTQSDQNKVLEKNDDKKHLEEMTLHPIDGKYNEFSGYLLGLKANQLYIIFKAITIGQDQSSRLNREILIEKIIGVIKEDVSALDKIKILARELDMADLLVYVPDN